MMRTTLNIDTPILEELKRLQKREKQPLGRLVSELLTEALATRGAELAEGPPFEWTTKAMGARVDLSDKEALYAELDRDE